MDQQIPSKFRQIAQFVAPFAVFSALFSLYGWFILLAIVEGLEGLIGQAIPLVGKHDDIDPGAVYLALLYAAFAWVIKTLLSKNNYTFAARCVAVLGFVFAPLAFGFASSWIWF